MFMFDTESRRQQFWLGSTAALMSAVAFSTNVALSRLAYDFGTNLHALNLIRAVVFLAVLIIAVWLSDSRVTIERKEIYRCLVLGILLCAEMYLLLASILFIPVALAILVFYTYPIMIAVWTWRTGRSHFSYFGLSVMMVAFIGLITTLAGSDRLLVGWDGRNGIALALIAAICLAARLPMPPIGFEAIAGDHVSLREHLGTPVLVNLWASWSRPSIQELREMAAEHQRLQRAWSSQTELPSLSTQSALHANQK